MTKTPTINLAIGPSCPVRCIGCYNHFGETSMHGGVVSANEVVDFAHAAKLQGIEQATVSGGDPLFHPEITKILTGLSEVGLSVKVDTVGTALLGIARVAYKGTGFSQKIDTSSIAPYVKMVNLPLDGHTQEVVSRFRRGRRNLLKETLAVAALLKNAGVSLGFNTVVSKANIEYLDEIHTLAAQAGADEWQLFEFDERGPNPSRLKHLLKLDPGNFDTATKDLKITSKDLASRENSYFLISDNGLAWQPLATGGKVNFGHITHDRDQVLQALAHHIQDIGSE